MEKTPTTLLLEAIESSKILIKLYHEMYPKGIYWASPVKKEAYTRQATSARPFHTKDMDVLYPIGISPSGDIVYMMTDNSFGEIPMENIYEPDLIYLSDTIQKNLTPCLPKSST